jgi:hypothetical protein
MDTPEAFIAKAEANLNDAFRHFEDPPNDLAKEFVELKLYACMFQYDVCAEMIGVLRNQPKGFASSVSLKSLVLRLFEYDRALNRRLIPRLLKLAEARGIPVERGAIKALRKTWKSELAQLQAWHDVRNKAAGHYDDDLAEQVRLLKSLTLDGVMSVVRGFLSFNMGLLVVLRDTGRGVTHGT